MAKHRPGQAYGNTYELNITFYDMLKGSFSGIDDYQMERFIASQTMMSVEGIPAFYIQSLFDQKMI